MRFIYGFILVAILAGCGQQPKEEAVANEDTADRITLTDTQIRNAGVVTDTVKTMRLSTELKVNGLVDVPPQNIVSVSFPLGGYLTHTRLLPGMHVRKGEVIASMEDPALVQLQQDYLMARARLGFLEKEYERQKALNADKVSADKVFQQTESEYQSQRVLVKGYSEKLRLIRLDPEKLTDQTISRTVPVYAPINGFVAKVNVNIGKYVNPSDVLFELINPDDMHAALTVFEKDIAKVKTGQRVLVSFVDEPDTDYPCEVLLVTRNVDENRSALVHCHFEKQPERLLPGMFLNARILVADAGVTAVPEEALVRFGSSEYVLEQTAERTFTMLAVETGIRENGMVEIRHKERNLTGLRLVVKNPHPVLSAIKNKPDEE